MFYNLFHKSDIVVRKLIRRNAGQALLELSIFGALIIMLIGVLVSYGLKYNFQQQVSIEAFRAAQELAQELDGGLPRGSSSITLVKDKHIPDPSNPFGVGSVTPIMASASITRDNRLDATPDDYEGLPKTIMRFQGNSDEAPVEYEFATAGLRTDMYTAGSEDDFKNMQKKYGWIFGSVSFDPEEYSLWLPVQIEIIDSVEGEVVDYGSAIRQARMLVDRDFFIIQCQKRSKPGEEGDCSDISNVAITMPWYVQGCYHNGAPFNLPSTYAGLYQTGDTWDFPRIEALYINPDTSKRVQALAMQPEMTQTTEKEFSLEKDENNSASATTDSIYWSTVTSRVMLEHNHLDPVTGVAQPPAGNPQITAESFDTERSDAIEFTWSTPWENQ